MDRSYLVLESTTGDELKIVGSVDKFMTIEDIDELTPEQFGLHTVNGWLVRHHNCYVVGCKCNHIYKGSMAEYTEVTLQLHEIIAFNSHNGISAKNRIDTHEMNKAYFSLLADEDFDEYRDKTNIYNLVKFQYQEDLSGDR